MTTTKKHAASGGRNALCPCGSGKRYKHCCGLLTSDTAASPSRAAASISQSALMARAADHYRKGEKAQAADIYQGILEQDSNHIEALKQLAVIRWELGQTDEAESLVKRMLKLGMRSPMIYYLLATIQEGAAKPGEALMSFIEALKFDPKFPDSQGILARILRDENTIVSLFDDRLALLAKDPVGVKLLNALGVVLYKQQKFDLAAAFFRKTLTHVPRDVGILMDSGIALSKLSHFDEAETCFRKAAEIDPNDASVFISWADMEERRHQTEQAYRLAQKGITLSPSEPLNIISYIIQSKYYRRQKDYSRSLQSLDSVNLKQRQSNDLLHVYYHERGLVLDKLGRFDEAFASYQEGKRLLIAADRKKYNRQKTLAKLTGLREFFTGARLGSLSKFSPQKNDGYPQPIFIVGFPRSGTTLTEQMLGSHPHISAAGELVYMGDLIKKSKEILASAQSYPDCLVDLEKTGNERVLERIRDQYLEQVAKLQIFKPGAHWFTDKMPFNLAHMGFIKLVFPEAPIIHIIRHPLDACLSTFFQPFSSGHSYSRSLEDTAFYYVENARLATHYKAELNLNYLGLYYEQLVEDPETQLRRLLAFIGELWDSRCLEFHKSARVARTASYAQVTEKLYTDSKHRYRHYRKHVEGIVPMLESVMVDLGYTVD